MNPTNIKAPAANGGRWKAATRDSTPPRAPWRTPEPPVYLRSDPLYDAAVVLADERVRVERDLVAIVCASPADSAAVLRSADVTPELVGAEDLRLILTAAEATGDQLPAAKMARRLLRYYGHWDDTDTRPFVCGAVWSDASLAALFHSFPFAPGVLLTFAERVVSIDGRQRGAMEHYRQALALLTGEVANG